MLESCSDGELLKAELCQRTHVASDTVHARGHNGTAPMHGLCDKRVETSRRLRSQDPTDVEPSSAAAQADLTNMSYERANYFTRVALTRSNSSKTDRLSDIAMTSIAFSVGFA